MILNPVSYVDCLVFCLFLSIHLLLNVGLWRTLGHVIAGIPFLAVELPKIIIRRVRFFLGLSGEPATAFDRHATVFEALAVRCARYAHVNLPPDILQAFFHKDVTYPFLRFRMLRQLYLRSPVHWEQITEDLVSPLIKGIWIKKDATKDPDIVLYYIHGGGFVMGSTHFYLEYLMAFHSLLRTYFHNPAIFAIEYSLAPGAQWPTQRTEVFNGYLHALSVAKSASRICVMGDSAGGSLGLSLLHNIKKAADVSNGYCEPPAFMVLVSPWMTLVSDTHRDSPDDYLSVRALHQFARLYAPDKSDHGVLEDASPSVLLRSGWKSMSPQYGYYIWYGDKELLAPDIRSAIQRMRKLGASVHVEARQAGGRNLHVWPLISFFLASDQERRMEEMKTIAAAIAAVMA